jgi:Ca2+-transporting ATPase
LSYYICIKSLTKAHALEIDESNLTGENEPILKFVENNPNNTSSPSNILFMGTLVRNGRGSALVFATGNNTELGSVLKTISEIEKPKTPLQTQMDLLGKNLSFFSFLIVGIVGVMGIYQGRPWLEVFTIAGFVFLIQLVWPLLPFQRGCL